MGCVLYAIKLSQFRLPLCLVRRLSRLLGTDPQLRAVVEQHWDVLFWKGMWYD